MEILQTKKMNIMRKVVAILLIAVLTMADFTLVGIHAISYAADVLIAETETNNKNVTFDCFFKDANGNAISETAEKINSESMKLFMRISVKNDGYLNGTISIGDSNFKLKNEILSSYINKIEGNTITLNQVNAGEVAEIEVGIESLTEDIINSGLLNMESKISLNGIYRNSAEKDIKIMATRSVKLDLTNPYGENVGVELNASVITNNSYEIENKEKRIVQVLIESGLKDNQYPIKETNIELNVPYMVEDVNVISRGTLATNGKIETEFNKDNWSYSEEEQKLNISIKNNEENGLIRWNKNGKDQFVVTYVMKDNKYIEDSTINVKSAITLYDSNSTVKDAETKMNVLQEANGIVTDGIKINETKIYKGKIYSGEEKNYNVTANIYVNDVRTQQKATLELLPATFESEAEEYRANIQYASTSINKNELVRILGEEGALKVLTADGNLITEITSKSEANEFGNIVINYPEEITAIKVETTPAIQTGTISLKTVKTIKQDGNAREVKATYTALKEKTANKEDKINLTETTTAVKLQTNKASLVTLANNTDIEITAILKTNSEEHDLFTNPNIKIELPKQVENIEIKSVNLLYEDELQNAEEKGRVLDINGTKVIEVNLTGAQTKHKDGAVEEATIIIDANLELNKKATNSKELIKMTCFNETSGISVNEEKPIEIISPRGMVTINTIKEYDVSSIGEEETKTAKLELGVEEKQAEANIEVINNNEDTIKDVRIIGDFPTKNQSNTIDITVDKIEVDGVDATVYYTEKEDATEDLNVSSNDWKTEITDGSKVKKYLISVNNMEQSEGLSASYKFNIPGNLQYNEQTYEGYKVLYNTANTSGEVKATTLGLTTGKGPELTTKINAKLGNKNLSNGEKVLQGEIVKYVVNVENTGSETATNVNISSNIPEGTIYVEPKENYVYEEGYYNEFADKKDVSFNIESIPAGESITKEFEVRVTKNINSGSEIENKVIVKYAEATVESNIVKNVVAEGNLSVSIKRATDFEVENFRGSFIEYFVMVENISTETQNAATVKLNIPEELEILKAFIIKNEEKEEIEVNNTISLGNIDAGETKVVHIIAEIKSLRNQDIKEVEISATAKSKQTSETVSNEVKEELKDCKLGISLVSENDNGFIKSGDIVEYTIRIKNESNIDSNYISIEDTIPEQLTVKSVTINGIEQENLDDNSIILAEKVPANGEVEAKVRTVVDFDEERKEPVSITNVATLYEDTDVYAKSEEVTHIIQAENRKTPEDPEDPDNPDNPTNNKQLISGIAWLDENQNGQRDLDEKLLDGIKVKLVDTSGNSAKDLEGNELAATTNNKGLYILNNVPKGQYIVVFDYDSSVYALTAYRKEGVSESKNSDVVSKQITINGVEGVYGITDIIDIDEDSVSSIDLGLMTATKFDIELNKYISKIVVQTNQETKTYTYDKTTLAKAEIAAKQLQGANVIIEYQIEIKNAGEIAGYVKNIVDYMPSSLKFSSELNKDWYQSETNLYNTSLANTKIEAGQIKTIPLILTKSMTEENTGLVNNKAEIAESYNEAGIPDIDSKAGNKVQGEDDMGSADVIIGVKTGAMVTYIALTLLVITIIGIGAIFVNKKINKDTNIEVNF